MASTKSSPSCVPPRHDRFAEPAFGSLFVASWALPVLVSPLGHTASDLAVLFLFLSKHIHKSGKKKILVNQSKLLNKFQPITIGAQRKRELGTQIPYCLNSNWKIRKGGSVVVKALGYKSAGPGIDSERWRLEFILWQLAFPRALGSTQPPKMSTRIFLGVKAAGAYGWRPYHLNVPSV